MNLCDTVATTDGQSLSQIDVGKINLGSDVVDDGTGDVQLRATFDTLQPRRRIDFHYLRTMVGFQQIYTGNTQTHDLCGANSRFAIRFVQDDSFGRTTAMGIATEILALSDPAHGSDNAVADHESANITTATFGDKFLHQHVLFRALQSLNDGFGRLYGLGQNHADALGAFKQFDDDRYATDTLDCRQDVTSFADKCGLRDPDVMPTKDLHAAKFVARVGDASGRTGCENVHLFKLTDNGCAKIGDRRADARNHGVIVAELFGTKVEIRFAFTKVDGKPQRVQDANLVSTCQSRFF